ncbi:MAG: interleukin-like EMT inducer domain-containing protein [Microcystaceae cyanobacterium]
MTESSFAENAEQIPRYSVSTALLNVSAADNEISFTFEHHAMGLSPYPNGINGMVFDAKTGQPQYLTAFEINNGQIDPYFADLVERLAENQVIALASNYQGNLQLSDRIKRALNCIGSNMGNQDAFQGYWVLIGRKGMNQGTAIESFASSSDISAETHLTVSDSPSNGIYPTLLLHKAQQIYLDNSPLNFAHSEVGVLKVLVFDELTGIPLQTEEIKLFDGEEALLVELIDHLPHGRGVALMLQGKSDRPLSPHVKYCGQLLGSRLIDNYPVGAAWAMVGYKGTPQGSAIETLQRSDPNALMLKVWLSPTLSPSAYWQPPQKLYAPNYHSDDAFGSALAIKGNTAVMAAPLSDTAIERNVGAVYVYCFHEGQWQQEASLYPHDIQYQLVFGKAVAVEGKNILVGAYLADNDWKMSAGALYSFQKQGKTWLQSQKIQPHDLHPEDCFGCAIALEGATALVGAYNSVNLMRHSTGAVYVFQENEGVWQDKQKLQPKDLQKGDSFGCAVAISGEFAAVGAYLGQETGVVYLFRQEKEIWQEYQTLHLPQLKKGDCFGYSVVLEGDMLLVGAKNRAYRHKIGAGAVYIFQFKDQQWQWKQTLQPADLRGYEHFGHSVAINGNLVMVGADQGNSLHQKQTGAVYTFQRQNDNWQPYLKLYAINGEEGDRFGYDLAIQGNLVLVGAPSAEAFGRKGAGVVYPGHF